MRIRRIAVLIDGGFFIKRLSRLVPAQHCDSAASVAESARLLCKRHVQKLTQEPFGTKYSHWLDHVYRLFYYDAKPYDGVAHHPILNHLIQFAKTPEAIFREELFHELRAKRKFALRLGKVTKEDGWQIKGDQITKQRLRTRDCLGILDKIVAQSGAETMASALTPEEVIRLSQMAERWRALAPDQVRLGMRQKGVDMRIGLDISTLTLKKQVDTIILVTGDSDFVPAAKLARREGVEFLLDPLWQQVNDDLHEHVDGVISAFSRPSRDPQPGQDNPLVPAPHEE